jgi:hypothetical protein
MGQAIGSSRRAALDGLVRILDAGAPEELFTGPEDEAAFLYALLVDAARARSSSYYWEICRTARRRGVTPEYVVDRAVVLLATIEERRRTDLYRILGVPGLASGEMIRQRWLDLAKRHHPDAGGEAALFRQAKEAYEILRDPVRRAEYERFWLRALGPFERVARQDETPLLSSPDARVRPAAEAAEEAVDVVDADGITVSHFFKRMQTLLAPISGAELDAIRTELARSIAALERARDDLATLAALKRAIA